MTLKTENWKEALLRVREGLKEANEPVVEKTEEELINEEIDALLNEMEETSEEVTEEAPVEEVVEESDEESHSVDKLTEKNMLGRLAKSMSLNEENKQKLFDYFESGELEQ
jgi:chromatin segregation and condensation protein Rec8/ScpA/Scc1 (kleisin family)